MATLGLIGNSRLIENKRILFDIKATGWLPKIDAILISSQNPHLEEEARQLCATTGWALDVIAVHWEKIGKDGQTVADRGALFRAYESICKRSSGILCYTNGSDGAGDAARGFAKTAGKPYHATVVLAAPPVPSFDEIQVDTRGEDPDFGQPDTRGGTATGDFDGRQQTDEDEDGLDEALAAVNDRSER